jgi:hypothetical protein
MPETTFTFTDVATEAERQTVMRNVAGVRLSQRLWNLSNENQKNINRVVQDSVRIGRDLVSTGKELVNIDPGMVKVRIPKYVNELADASRQARALSDNSILQQTVRKYESYINKLTRGLEPEDIQKRYAHLGIRGASRMLVRRLSSQNEEVYASAVDKWVKRKASYQARVVARNETNEAHWNAMQAEASDKPYLVGFKWNFGSHPRADVCNELHDQNLYGLGNGVYPVGSVPPRPHPNCNCYLSQEMDKDYFATHTPSAELMQQVKDDPRFDEFHSWADSWLGKIGAAPLLPRGQIFPLPTKIDIEKSIEDAVNDAYNFGNRTGNEVGIFIDNDTGQMIDRTAGSSNYVALGDAYSKLKKDGNYTLVHNHPTSASFSSTNILNLLQPGIRNLVVIGHDGTKYFLSWKEGTKIPPNNERIRDVITQTWRHYESQLMDKYLSPIRRKVDELIAAGKMKYGDPYPKELIVPAWKEHSHEIMQKVAETGEMAYRRELP